MLGGKNIINKCRFETCGIYSSRYEIKCKHVNMKSLLYVLHIYHIVILLYFVIVNYILFA